MSDSLICRSLKSNDFTNYLWKDEENCLDGIVKYQEVINYHRNINGTNQIKFHCVMCGLNSSDHEVYIPSQNKNVCKNCDSAFWLYVKYNVILKFCKGMYLYLLMY